MKQLQPSSGLFSTHTEGVSSVDVVLPLSLDIGQAADCQPIAELTYREEQTFTLIFTRVGNLKSPANLTCMS